MPIPVIDTRTSEQAWLTGRPQEWQPYATESPTSWSATGLPSGVSINTSTGLVSGTPTSRGVAIASIVATNAHGDSAPLLVPFSVRGAAGLSQDSLDQLSLLIDFDLTTGEITIPGIDPPAAIGVEELAQETATTRIKRELMRVKSGEEFPILVGFKRDGVLQDIDVTRIELSARENEPEESYEITEDSSAVTKVGSGEDTRFRTSLRISEELLEGVFSNFEDDNGTQAGLLAEISAAVVSSAFDWTTEEKTESFVGFGHGDTEVDTFVFTGLPQATTGPATYTAMCQVDFTMASARDNTQDLAIPIDFTVEWNGSSFDVSDVPANTSVVGAEDDEGSHWIATLEATSITGTASGVDIELTTSATGFPNVWIAAFDVFAGVNNDVIGDDGGGYSGNGANHDFEVDNLSDTNSGQALCEIEPGDTATDIKNKFNAEHNAAGFTPTDPVQSVVMDNARNRVILVLPASRPWNRIRDIPTGDEFDTIAYGALDNDATADHKVELSGDPADDQVLRSSDTFVLTAERSINRD